MAIRKNTNPREMDLQPEMRDILMRNGMQAHILSNSNGYQLAVQGHDSPLLTYNLTEKQMHALTDWGTNYANKKAYNVFTSIVGKRFFVPDDWFFIPDTADTFFYPCHVFASEQCLGWQ